MRQHGRPPMSARRPAQFPILQGMRHIVILQSTTSGFRTAGDPPSGGVLMDHIPGVLYQHRDKRPFRLVGRPPCYLRIDERGCYFTQDMSGTLTSLSHHRGEHLRDVSIPLIPPDQRLPEGF